MNANQLLAHFERISEASDAIARLRRFILDLAVRGKLVEQDPEDETAEELLCWIQAEKALMEAEGAIRREKQFLPIDQSTTPFTCPPGWTWTHLGAVSLISQGFAFSSALFSKDKSEGLPLVKIGDIGTDCPDVFTQEFPGRSYLVEPGDILLGLSGSIKCSIWSGPQALLNQRIARLKPAISEIPVEWLLMAVGSCINKWKEETSKLTVQNVKAGQLSGAVITLPPLAEQHRIVAKVNELMALCHQLEAARQQREQGRERLMAATLQRLNQPAEDPASFRKDASFALQVLPSLTTTPALIKQLRQTILNLAARGKLVEQDPEDIDERNFFRLAPQAKTCDLIPRSWLYVPLAELLSEDTRNGYSRKPDDAVDGVPILRISAGTARPDGLVAEEEFKLISGIDDKLLGQYEVRTGDLLACRFNGNKAYVGRLSLFSGYLHQRFIYPDKLIRIRLAEELAEPSFLRWISGADLVREEVETKCATTVGNWGISAGKLKTCLVPLPPLAEQHRIVAKVDELMALCDQLEQQLSQADQQRRRLLEAVVAEALQSSKPALGSESRV